MTDPTNPQDPSGYPPPPSFPPPPPPDAPGAYAAPVYGAPPTYAPPGVPNYGGPAKFDGFAVAALVLAIVAPLSCGLLAILAVIFAYVARGRIRRTNARGAGQTTAALIIGWIEIGLLVIGVVTLVVVGVRTNGDAVTDARKFNVAVYRVAQEKGVSPRSVAVIRQALQDAGLSPDDVQVGNTQVNASVATRADFERAGWKLDINPYFEDVCYTVPPDIHTNANAVDNNSC